MAPVAVSEFRFVIRLSGREPFDGVLEEVAANVFRHLGCASPVVTDLVAQLNAVVGPTLGGSEELDVQFHAYSGCCEVVVVVDDQEVWRMTRRLP